MSLQKAVAFQFGVKNCVLIVSILSAWWIQDEKLYCGDGMNNFRVVLWLRVLLFHFACNTTTLPF